MAFAGQSRKDPSKYTEFVGLHGEKCWLLIKDHFTDFAIGHTFKSKAVPLNTLRNILAAFCPGTGQHLERYCHMDQGELYMNPSVRRIFEKRGFTCKPTGSDDSKQNGVVERAHRTTAKGIRAYLIGANLPAEFWPYAFHMHI